MRLNASILALCVCLYQVRAASIKTPEKNLDDLDNVDLADPDLIDQPSVVDIDNHLRKNIVDVPVKIIQESNIKVLNENSNDYVPDNDDSINIKRLEIDISDPGLPQRQEHETQNPERYGAKEKTIYAIKQSIVDTQNIFNIGLKSVSNSFKTLFAVNEDLPAIQQNIQNLRQTFEGQIDKLNNTIRSHFKDQIKPSEGAAIDPDLEVVNSGLRNLENNFRSGVDTLTEGVEVLSILREDDEVARAEGIPQQTGTPDASAPQPAPPVLAVQNPSQITQPVMNFLNVFRQGIVTAVDNLNHVVSYALTGHKPEPIPQATGNPIVNFIQGITGSNNAQNPSNQVTTGQASPAGAQNDAVPAPGPTLAPWNIGAAFQQVQNSIQNIINPQQNQQQSQLQPTSNGPISQAIQNIVQFVRPGQGHGQQQVQLPAAPAPAKAPEVTVAVTSNNVPAKPAPALATAIPVPAPVQSQLVQAPQPGPIQQLVQNNPIIKGIQSAVQRIQNPSSDTSRNEEVKENVKNNVDPKGHHGGYINNNNNNNNNNVNQDDIKSSGRVGISPETVEVLEEDIQVKSDKEIAEKIVAEERKTPSISDKTE